MRNQTKINRICLRLNEYDYGLLLKALKKTKQSKSDFVRQAVIEEIKRVK